jgi:hypothetical protein
MDLRKTQKPAANFANSRELFKKIRDNLCNLWQKILNCVSPDPKNSSVKNIDITLIAVTIISNPTRSVDILATRTSVNEQMLVPFI